MVSRMMLDDALAQLRSVFVVNEYREDDSLVLSFNPLSPEEAQMLVLLRGSLFGRSYWWAEYANGMMDYRIPLRDLVTDYTLFPPPDKDTLVDTLPDPSLLELDTMRLEKEAKLLLERQWFGVETSDDQELFFFEKLVG